MALPLAPRLRNSTSASPRIPLRRVLWVDDDPNLTASYARRLRRAGVEVIPASDGMTGYWLALTQKPDLVITDLRMPRWQGQSLLECLSQNVATAHLPLLVVSGYTTPELTSQLQRWGVSRVLDKPVPFDQLLAALHELGC